MHAVIFLTLFFQNLGFGLKARGSAKTHVIDGLFFKFLEAED